MFTRLPFLTLGLLLLVLGGCSSMMEKPPSGQRETAQMQQVLDAYKSLQPKPIEQLTVSEARKQPTMTDAVYQLLQDKGDAAPKKLPPVAKIETSSITASDGYSIPIRIYTPKGEGPFPVVVYYHGGGWVLANIDTYDSSARALSNLANAVVVSVEYRKAPEYKFPTAHEDSYAALQYVMKNASKFGGDPAQVAVAGESAGGNLATAVCLMAKERKGAMPIHQLLIYPVTNYDFNNPSYRDNKDAKPLNAAMMRWFFNNYLNTPNDGENKFVSPLRARIEDLKGLPPTTVITAEIDPLRNEGIAYEEKLKIAGVDIEAKDFEGVTHEFFGMAPVLNEAVEAEVFAAERLKGAFDKAKNK